mmetsp:Transcript_36657/g.85621  ORF Transcript_36657/g.85621 Transcript_36657/m.85621 type:complete len:425 (-) Transcript_36657:61-1335(-)
MLRAIYASREKSDMLVRMSPLRSPSAELLSRGEEGLPEAGSPPRRLSGTSRCNGSPNRFVPFRRRASADTLPAHSKRALLVHAVLLAFALCGMVGIVYEVREQRNTIAQMKATFAVQEKASALAAEALTSALSAQSEAKQAAAHAFGEMQALLLSVDERSRMQLHLSQQMSERLNGQLERQSEALGDSLAKNFSRIGEALSANVSMAVDEAVEKAAAEARRTQDRLFEELEETLDSVESLTLVVEKVSAASARLESFSAELRASSATPGSAEIAITPPRSQRAPPPPPPPPPPPRLVKVVFAFEPDDTLGELVSLYWLCANHTERLYSEIPQGMQVVEMTQPGQCWRVRDSRTGHHLVDRYCASGSPQQRVSIRSTPHVELQFHFPRADSRLAAKTATIWQVRGCAYAKKCAAKTAHAREGAGL